MIKFGSITDTQTKDYDDGEWIYLPHSCDAWVIGGVKEAKQLIEDLQDAIQQLSEGKSEVK